MKSPLRPAFAALALWVATPLLPASAASGDGAVSNAQLLKKLEALETKVQSLEKKVAQYEGAQASPAAPAPPAEAPGESTASAVPGGQGLFGLGYRSKDVLRIGAYGEMKFGQQQSPGGWRTGFDAARLVLLPTLQITDNIIFNAELEWEHGGIAVDDDDKLTGSTDIEQAYVDFKFNEYFNWRAPGVDVTPFGYINLFHEPTQFYSVNRPELYNGLIPSTWFGGSTSIYGKIVDNLNYQFQVNTGLEDVGLKDGLPGDRSPYDPGVSGAEALGLSRVPIGDFKQNKNALGYAFRFSYTPPAIPGLGGSTSVFYTPNIVPRGAYGEDGRALGHSSVTMLDTELRYRLPRSGLELRAEAADVVIGSPASLRANNDGDPANNVGRHLWGFSLEAAYHFDLAASLRHGWEVVPFYRYTFEDFQTHGFGGADQNLPTGQGRRQFHTLGLAVFPAPQVVLKLDYQFALDDAPGSPRADHLLGGVGFFF